MSNYDNHPMLEPVRPSLLALQKKIDDLLWEDPNAPVEHLLINLRYYQELDKAGELYAPMF
jgi:hypothetical protein